MTTGRKKNPLRIIQGSTVTIPPVHNMVELESKLGECNREKTEHLNIKLYADTFTEPLLLEMLSKFPNLKSVDIIGGGYSTIDLTPLQECGSFKRLAIGVNKRLQEIDLRPVLKNPSIKSILLKEMPLKDGIKLDNIGECDSMRALWFDCGNTAPYLPLIGECTELQELSFYTRKEELDLWNITGLQKLTHLMINLSLQSYEDETQPVDTTALLALPNLVSLELIEIMSVGTRKRIPIVTGLPEIVSTDCGKTWGRINTYLNDVNYFNSLSTDWTNTYQILGEYASFFAPVYWPNINKYILESCGIANDKYHIDFARCVLPFDLLQLVEPKPNKPTTETIEKHLDVNFVDMVARYLDGGYSTKGFDIERIASNEPQLISFIPRIVDMRLSEIFDLTFIQVQYRSGMLYETWESEEMYYIHPLKDTVYGNQVLESRNLVHPRNQYMLPIKEIESIEKQLNIEDIKTKWTYIPVGEYE